MLSIVRMTVVRRALIVGLASIIACDNRPLVAVIPSCLPVIGASPANAIINVSGTVTVDLALNGSCPPALVRNETPTIIQVDSLSAASIRITALTVGNGRVRIRAGGDTLVSTIVPVTVIP